MPTPEERRRRRVALAALTAVARRAELAVRDTQPLSWGLPVSTDTHSVDVELADARLRAEREAAAEARTRAVVDLAMRVGEVTLATGASAADVTATVLELTTAYGLHSVHVDVTFTSLAVSVHRGAELDPITVIRMVRNRTVDFDRLARLQEFVASLSENTRNPDAQLDIHRARAQFAEIVTRPRPYRPGVVAVAGMALGASVAALLGGNLAEMAVAGLAVGAVDKVMLWMARRQVSAFFTQAVGAMVPTVLALVLMVLRDRGMLLAISPSMAVAAGIVALLAGLSLVGAAQDAIDGFYVTAGARTFEVVVLTLGIVLGIVLVLGVGQRLGVQGYLAPESSFARDPVVQILAAAVIAASFAVIAFSTLRTVLVGAVLGSIGWSSYLLAEIFLSVGSPLATAIGGAVVGFAAPTAARRFRVPSLAITTAGIVALLPGSLVYRGLFQLVEPAVADPRGRSAGATLLLAAITGLGLAAGVSIGTFFGRVVRTPLLRRPRRASDGYRGATVIGRSGSGAARDEALAKALGRAGTAPRE